MMMINGVMINALTTAAIMIDAMKIGALMLDAMRIGVPTGRCCDDRLVDDRREGNRGMIDAAILASADMSTAWHLDVM